MKGSFPRCPDCGVEMEQMTVNASGYDLQVVSDENKDGFLGSLGAKQRFDLNSFVCSECGLTQLYADTEE